MMETTENNTSFSEELSKLMGRGKRHYICNEVEQAVECFEEANQLLNEKYGQLADECGEAYLYYGKSLIDLARKETGILGGALKVGEEQNDDDSEDDEEAGLEEMETEETPDKDTSVDEKTAKKTEEPGAGKSADKSAEENEEAAQKTECNIVPADNGENKEEEALQNKIASSATTAGDNEENKGDAEESQKKTECNVVPADDNKENKGDAEEAPQKKIESTATPAGDAEEVSEKSESNTTPAGNKGEVKKTETKHETDDSTAGTVGDDTTSSDMDTKGDGKTTQPGSEEKAEKNEDITTMELAWEILELSRLIHERQETREARLNLAQTYLKLGEIQMERELFLEAIDEFHKCYQIQQKYLEADDRLLAETLYNIGLAYSIYSPPQHEESKENYTKALDVIELRMKNIEARLQEFDSKGKGKQKASDDDPCVKDRKELSELQDLYPEIKAKIDDAQEMMANAVCSKAELIQSIAVKKPNGDTDKPATDISYLVKRKRKPEGSEDSENPDTVGPAKKPRQENGTENTNGH